VLDYAKAHKLVTGENPAAWPHGANGQNFSALAKHGQGSPSMPYRDVPEFVANLRQVGTVPALTFEFAVLTAARIGEVLGAKWDEIDIANKVWTISASRMKAGVEHRVPLSERAIDILAQLGATRSCAFVFPGQRVDETTDGGIDCGAEKARPSCRWRKPLSYGYEDADRLEQALDFPFHARRQAA
jgi:integrase